MMENEAVVSIFYRLDEVIIADEKKLLTLGGNKLNFFQSFNRSYK